jgi:hypothetical protein
MADALSLQSANLVRQKAYNAVYGSGTGTTTDSVSPYHFYAVKAFFLHMACNKGNPDLQFFPYTAEQITTNGGLDADVGACTLYVWFMKARRTSGTTSSFQAIHDADDNSATTTTITTQRIKATGEQAFFVWPNGQPIATDIVLSAATAVGGATESSAADATDGFLIIGA